MSWRDLRAARHARIRSLAQTDPGWRLYQALYEADVKWLKGIPDTVLQEWIKFSQELDKEFPEPYDIGEEHGVIEVLDE